MKRMRFLLCGVLAIGISQMAMSDSSTRHSLRIIVRRTNEFSVEGKGRGIEAEAESTIRKAYVSGENVGFHLKWRTDQFRKKITVSVDLTSSPLKIQVQAVKCTGGIPSGKVFLTGSDCDVLTDLLSEEGRCELRYIDHTQTPVSTGTEGKKIFYTITDVY